MSATSVRKYTPQVVKAMRSNPSTPRRKHVNALVRGEDLSLATARAIVRRASKKTNRGGGKFGIGGSVGARVTRRRTGK